MKLKLQTAHNILECHIKFKQTNHNLVPSTSFRCKRKAKYAVIWNRMGYFETFWHVPGTCHSSYTLSKGPKSPSPNIVAQSLTEGSLFSPRIPKNNIL